MKTRPKIDQLVSQIAFPNGNRARAVHAPGDADGAVMASALQLPPPRAVLLLNGGASDMSPADMARLRRLLSEGVARIAAEENIAVIDGGTQAGVMEMMGEGWTASGNRVPLIGVCPAALVTWPGGPSDDGRVPLEPNHTHFVLTEGESWGDETETMFALAAALGKDVPSVAILANGGSIAGGEVLHNVREGREIIVIRGSGRLADEIASVVAGEMDPPNDAVAAIVQEGQITVFDVNDESEALVALIRRKLFGSG